MVLNWRDSAPALPISDLLPHLVLGLFGHSLREGWRKYVDRCIITPGVEAPIHSSWTTTAWDLKTSFADSVLESCSVGSARRRKAGHRFPRFLEKRVTSQARLHTNTVLNMLGALSY